MVIQNVTVNDCTPQTIVIGRRGTYDTMQIAFDLTNLVQTYGSGTAVLAVKRSQDASAYPAVTSQADNTLTWTITETDTYYVGSGECQLMWYVDGGLAKTIIYTMVVMRDILSTTEEPPDGYENWVEHLTELGAETQQNAQAAAQSASDAESAKDDAVTAKEAAEEAAETAQEAVVHAPIIQNGYWYIWNDGQYVDTGVRAEGQKGDKGDTGEKGDTGNGIASITKTGTSGLVDTYTVTYTDGTTTTFTVTNGAKGDKGDTGATGNGIQSITKTGTSGNVDTYTITYTNGQTTTFTVTNGAVSSVAGKTGAVTLDANDVAFSESGTYDDGTVGKELSNQKNAISELDDVVFTETDNLIDFTKDFNKWEQGFPGGSQGYAIHLNEKIVAEAGQIVYGRITPVTLAKSINLNIRAYNNNDEKIGETNVANTNSGYWPYTLPENTVYYYISLTTSSASYPITPASVKSLNLEIYCGETNVPADGIYPKYLNLRDELNVTNENVEKIEGTLSSKSLLGYVDGIDCGQDVRFFGPYEKSYTVASTSDNWKAESYVIITPDFNAGDYTAVKCEGFHGYGTNAIQIACKDANNNNLLSVTIVRSQINEDGFITKYFKIPENTATVTWSIYGVSNTTGLPDAEKPVVGDVTYIKGAYAIVAKSVPNINPLFRIEEQPDTLWNEEDATRENHESVYSSGRIGYVFLTDLHVDYEDNPTGIAFQKNQLHLACDIANCSDVDFLVLGGDYIDGAGTRATATKWMRWITSGLKSINKPVIVCRGNHDKNKNANPAQSASEQITTEDFYAIMQAPFRKPEYVYDDAATVPELYFYYDIPLKKVRIIAYDSIFCDNPDEQIKWICEQALTKPDEGWKYIVVTHVPFNNQYNTGGMSWVAQHGAQMESIIAALNNRTTYTGIAGNYSINVDFTLYQSSVICISTGHQHTGLITWDDNTDSFFTTTGCACANAGYGTFNDPSVERDDAQTTGRNNMSFDNSLKYCFDLLSVSPVSVTRSRFGNGTDKTVNHT